MTKQEIINQLRVLKVKSSVSVSIDDLATRWAGRAEVLVAAAFQILSKIRKGVPEVELRARCNGVSGYGRKQANNQRLECFHVGVNKRPRAMILYQHGKALDPNNLFRIEPLKKNNVYGYLPEGKLNHLSCVTGVLIQSYRNIIGR
jgi:hypothetical protein